MWAGDGRAALWLVLTTGCGEELKREVGAPSPGLGSLGEAGSSGTGDDEGESGGSSVGGDDGGSTGSGWPPPDPSPDDGGDETTTGAEPPPLPTNADFCEVDGTLVMEVEHFAANDGFAEVARPDASGGLVMQVGASGRLDLSVHFDTAGEVYVWIRTYVPLQDSENNGLFLDLDGTPLVAPAGHPLVGTSDIYLEKVGWAWAPRWQGDGVTQGPVTFSVTPGDHTLTIRKRLIERPEIDKIVLSFSGAPPQDLGPQETPCP